MATSTAADIEAWTKFWKRLDIGTVAMSKRTCGGESGSQCRKTKGRRAGTGGHRRHGKTAAAAPRTWRRLPLGLGVAVSKACLEHRNSEGEGALRPCDQFAWTLKHWKT